MYYTVRAICGQHPQKRESWQDLHAKRRLQERRRAAPSGRRNI